MHTAISVIGKIAAAGLAMLVTACAHNPAVRPETKFNAASPDSIVIIGLRSARPGMPQMIFSGGPNEYREVMTLWERTDSPSGQPGANEKIAAWTDRAEYKVKDSPQHTALVIQRVPAGTYMLREIHTFRGMESLTTLVAVHAPKLQFTVKPGEALYIGDLHFDVVSFPAKLEKLSRNDRMVETAMTAYPGVTVPVSFRPPGILHVGQSTARPLPVIPE